MNANFAIIGGSSTCSIRFPADLIDADITVLEENRTFSTPFGESPPFTLFSLGREQVLTCRMHGWRSGVARGTASRQVFWVLREAGVHTILAEGGVGCLREDLSPGDLVIPHDYIDLSLRKDVSLGDDYLLIMRDPLCPRLRSALIAGAQQVPGRKVLREAVYAVTEGRHFESRAEISLFSQWRVTVVGQSLAPEVYLAREIAACYAGVYLVVNYAEGISGDWSHEVLQDLFYSEAQTMGQLLLRSLRAVIHSPGNCSCATLRKPSLIKKHLT
jgi:5'-methylthioadenosine phosphorylase